MPPAPSPVFDETAAHPDVRAVRAGLDARDWATVTATVARYHGGARTRLIRWTGRHADRAFLESVRAADPADSLAAAMLGERFATEAAQAASVAEAIYEHVLFMSGREAARFLRAKVEIVGPWVTEDPWHLVGDPPEQFMFHRARCARRRATW